MSAVSNRKFPYFKLYINNLSNGSVLANFSCMKDNEANLCNGYNYANGRFCFNYRGAKSKITDYVFGDGLGTGGAVAKLSDLVKRMIWLLNRCPWLQLQRLQRQIYTLL